MFSTRKRCHFGSLIWGYQKFYSIPPKKKNFRPKNGQIWPKNGIFGPFDPMPDRKTIRTSCLGGFSVTWVSKLLLPPIRLRFLAPKGRIWSKICIFGHFGPNIGIFGQFCPLPNQKTLRRRCLCGFSVMLIPKLLLSLVKIRIFCPKTTKFSPKLAFLVISGQV